ncbi:beta-propeller fold lactonase family protein [Persephonella sp. KM09-Lau-8]|uniref:beta-propeller fold lactonase family protein n=1 Tax=Persephonella sp. KM09-Lau-8 TaxID=1158345 RepID=UPI0004964A27|nr:beta-propeller fold lactonase family protein [Persephonella sp. KM09-Lau-8]
MKLKQALFTGKFLALTMAGAVMFSCSDGGGGSTKSPGDNNSGGATAQYQGSVKLTGSVKDSTVKIYEIDDNGNPVLKWTETSDANGKFNTHADELDPNKLYLYEATDGQDCVNNTCSENKGKLRALAKGEDIKTAAAQNDFSLSPISEIAAEKVLPDLTRAADEGNYNPEDIDKELDKTAKGLVDDVNNDGTVDNLDTLTFDPTDNNDKNAVKPPFKGHVDDIAEDIKDGKLPLLAANPVLDEEDTGGNAKNAATSPDGKYAYVVNDDGKMSVFDISDPENMEQKNPSPIDTGVTTPKDLKPSTDGEYAYLAGGDDGVAMLDLDDNNDGDKIDPTNVATVDPDGDNTKGSAKALDVVNNGTNDYVVVADGDEGVALLKADPNNTGNELITIETKPTGATSDANDVAASEDGKYAYVADGENGLVTFKIDPNDENGDGNKLENLNTDDTSEYGKAQAVAVSPDGKYAYVTVQEDNPDPAQAKAYLLTYALCNPEDPVLLNVEDLPKGSVPSDIVVSPEKEKLFIPDGDNGLISADISDPSKPEVDGFVNTDGSVNGVALKDNGTYAIVTDNDKGVKSIATDLIPPIVLGYASTYAAIDLTTTKDKLYSLIADAYCGLRVADVSDPANPKTLNDCGWDPTKYANSVAVSNDGNTAYVATLSGGIDVYDVSTKGTPNNIANIPVQSSGDACNNENANCDAAHDVYLDENKGLLFVAEGTAGLRIFNISDNSEVGSLDDGNTSASSGNDIRTVELTPDGQKAILGDIKRGVVIVDVSDPANPTEEQVISTGIGLQDSVAINGNYIYVAAGRNGIKVFDATSYNEVGSLSYKEDPTDPIFANAIKISTDGKVAFVSDVEKGLVILNISDPANPVVLGMLDTPGESYSSVIDGDKSIGFVADGSKGLLLLDVSSFK